MYFVVHHWQTPAEGGGYSDDYGVLGPFTERASAEQTVLLLLRQPTTRVAQVHTGPELERLLRAAPALNLPGALVRQVRLALALWRAADE